jgi:hypothetical protein
MSTIDEIMAFVFMSQVHTGNFVDGSGSKEEMDAADNRVRSLIAAAIADAKREGAEQMRIEAGMLCTAQADEADGDIAYRDACHDCAKSVRALPLPTGPRQAVRLTDEQIDALRRRTGYAAGPIRFHRIALDVKTAVLTKNGLGGSNG